MGQRGDVLAAFHRYHAPVSVSQGQSAVMKIVADENMPGLASLESLGELVRVPGRRMTAAQVTDADILLVRSVTRVDAALRSEEHTSELQSRENLVCRLLLEKKKKHII